ncbi:MAG: MFS transporter [Calditrichia bacterium]
MLKRIYLTYKTAYAGLPTEAWMLSLVVLINRSGSMVLFFMSLYLTRELGYSIAAAGRMLSIYGLGSLGGSYLGGWLSDLVGTRKVQILSLTFTGLGFVLLSFVRSPFYIGIMLFILALIGEAFRPANASAIAEVCPPILRARCFALNRLAINLGVTIGPALGGMLAVLDYHYIFWADGLTCFMAAFMLWFFFRGVLPLESGLRKGEQIIARSPLKDGLLLAILGMVLAVGIVFVQVFNTWPIYLREAYGLLENHIGLLLALNAVLIVMFEMPLIHRIEKRDTVKIMGIGILFLCGGFAILPLGGSPAYAALTVFIWTIGEMLVFPFLTGFIANRAEDRNRGKYMGMMSLSFSLSFVFGPALGTWIYDHWGATVLWLNFGVWGILIFLGFGVINHYLKMELQSKKVPAA